MIRLLPQLGLLPKGTLARSLLGRLQAEHTAVTAQHAQQSVTFDRDPKRSPQSLAYFI